MPNFGIRCVQVLSTSPISNNYNNTHTFRNIYVKCSFSVFTEKTERCVIVVEHASLL